MNDGSCTEQQTGDSSARNRELVLPHDGAYAGKTQHAMQPVSTYCDAEQMMSMCSVHQSIECKPFKQLFHGMTFLCNSCDLRTTGKQQNVSCDLRATGEQQNIAIWHSACLQPQDTTAK